MTPPLQPQGRIARAITLAVTNATKVGGLAVALNELLLRPTLRPAAIALAAFMMAGAQGIENAVLSILDHLLGRSAAHDSGGSHE